MGLFYIDTSEQNTLEYQKKHAKEIEDYARESLNIAELATKEIFPEFLWQVQFNEYEGDDYKLRGTCSNPNVLKAYTIKRKYSNYWDYLDALEAYMEYVNFIDSAYGSFEMMKNASDLGMSVIYIPKRPKLTNKKTNKKLIQSGFIPSRIIEDFVVNEQIIGEAIAGLTSNEISYDEDYELPKYIAKIQEREQKDKTKSDRIGSIYATSGSMQGIDAIISFLNNPNNDAIDNRGKTSNSFTEEMESIHEYDYIPQDMIDDMFTPRESFISSSYLMNPEKQRQENILAALTEAGFGFLDKAVTSGMDRDVVRAVTRKYNSLESNYENLTPKQLKKLKKKEAKRRKRANERLIGDRRIQDVLLKNRAHLSRDDSLNFRLCDVIPEDD